MFNISLQLGACESIPHEKNARLAHSYILEKVKEVHIPGSVKAHKLCVKSVVTITFSVVCNGRNEQINVSYFQCILPKYISSFILTSERLVSILETANLFLGGEEPLSHHTMGKDTTLPPRPTRDGVPPREMQHSEYSSLGFLPFSTWSDGGAGWPTGQSGDGTFIFDARARALLPSAFQPILIAAFDTAARIKSHTQLTEIHSYIFSYAVIVRQ